MDIVYRTVQYIINPLIYLLIGVSVLYFLWGVFKFVRSADNPDERATGAQHILWGVIGIAIIFSAFALVHFVMNSLGSASAHPTTIQ